MSEGEESRKVRKTGSPKKVKAERIKAKGDLRPEKNQSALDTPHSAINKSEIENPTSERRSPLEHLEETDHSEKITLMEVHHHPQLEHKPKPWKEYLLEGLMIFVAVTMGFFAESLREHISDKEKETQYIQSLAEDLKGDIKMLNLQIRDDKQGLVMLDSLIIVLDKPIELPAHGDDLYYYGRLGPRIKNLIVNMRTFEQLRNSGNFRLISAIGVSNHIMSYYEKVAYIKQIEDIMNQEFIGYKEAAARVFEPAVFRAQERDNGEVKRSANNPALQKDASQYIKQLALYATYMNGSRRQIMASDAELLISAKELLNYLQKQYDLDDD